MTYPPGNPGYPPAQSPGSYGAPASTSFAKSEDAESNLKHYLTIAVAVLGVLTYLASYFPMVSRVLPNGDELVEKGSTLPVDLVLLAGLLAGVSLLPKAKNYLAVVAAISLLGSLLLIQDTVDASDRGAGLWIAVTAGVVQAGLAVAALLLDAGVITAPAPRPKYDQYYGQYGGYYGQQQAPYQQSGYGAQYGGYPSGQTTGGFPAQPGPQPSSVQSQQHGSPTPPTGFPSFSPPPSPGSNTPGQGNSSDQGGPVHGQHEYGSGQQPQAPSGPSQS
ncbi:DUF5336 domain-containing protein [Mycobacterium paraterrae]|uniref:DUF5336 domain-containing protein n=1 Tax=Mycobacterium paraterrae TaxID=577492 RepID=A0ABY3VMF1_9MYCO|nr:DUF5336 domain-containing protein [Mycobacterium paraterrae]UMB70606.1 DUF5336 domain-containing protein [Mycobacterium paraterrae]